ncbi:MAG TPA: helix-turn-helix domain-containing protein [Miltoncostaea sp.]|nr:helix-turn-helix domain-containing protein [Miltoncostaea sp.]
MTSELVRAAPAPALRDVIVRLTGHTDRTGAPVRSTELPVTFVPVVLDLGDGWWIGDGRRPDAAAERFGPFVAGLCDLPVAVGHDGSAHCVQLDLHPRAARRLLKVPMRELADRTVALDDVLGADGRELVERLAGTRGWPARFALVQRAVARRLADAPPLRAEVGVAPKRFARIARFERVVAMLAAEPATGLAAVAARCGYADQAHMSREVAALGGTTPAALRARAVNSVQDPGREAA